MNVGIVTAVIGLGAGVIALWIDVRFPQLAPQEMAKALLHAAASLAVGYATSPPIQALVGYEDHRLTLLAIFGIVFPSIVYCLLAGLWVIKLAQRTLSGASALTPGVFTGANGGKEAACAFDAAPA